MLKILVSLVCLLFCASCCRDYVTVRTEYFNRHNLASYYVETPDPKLDCPEVGQRLILSWAFPDEVFQRPDLHFEMVIRFGNKQEIKRMFDVYDRCGIYTYTLADSQFFEYDGIQTYKIELYSGEDLVEEWRHQLWVDLITFKPREEDSSEEK